MKSIYIVLSLLMVALLPSCDSDTLNHLPGMDPWMDGNPADFISFTENAEKGPVVMLNLLKFKELSSDGKMSGAESYANYGKLASPFVKKHGGEIVWLGAAEEHLVGDTNYDWDMVLLVKWPARQNLLDLIEDEDYQAIAHYRKEGLERAMLIALNESKAASK